MTKTQLMGQNVVHFKMKLISYKTTKCWNHEHSIMQWFVRQSCPRDLSREASSASILSWRTQVLLHLSNRRHFIWCYATRTGQSLKYQQVWQKYWKVGDGHIDKSRAEILRNVWQKYWKSQWQAITFSDLQWQFSGIQRQISYNDYW